MNGRDWLSMSPEDFDASLVPVVEEEPALFDLDVDVAAVAAPSDGYGTGDLLAELDESGTSQN